MSRTSSKEFAWTEARVEEMKNIIEDVASGEDAWTEERLVHRVRDDYRAPITECTIALRICVAGVNWAVRTRARARCKTLDPAISETWLYAWRRLKTIPQPLAVSQITTQTDGRSRRPTIGADAMQAIDTSPDATRS